MMINLIRSMLRLVPQRLAERLDAPMMDTGPAGAGQGPSYDPHEPCQPPALQLPVLPELSRDTQRGAVLRQRHQLGPHHGKRLQLRDLLSV